jgi:hypothetical protein
LYRYLVGKRLGWLNALDMVAPGGLRYVLNMAHPEVGLGEVNYVAFQAGFTLIALVDPLVLKGDRLVSSLCFCKCNLYRYTEEKEVLRRLCNLAMKMTAERELRQKSTNMANTNAKVGLHKLNPVDP